MGEIKEWYCPYFNSTIEDSECYDINAVIDRCLKPSLVPEVKEWDKAIICCENCIYRGY